MIQKFYFQSQQVPAGPGRSRQVPFERGAGGSYRELPGLEAEGWREQTGVQSASCKVRNEE